MFLATCLKFAVLKDNYSFFSLPFVSDLICIVLEKTFLILQRWLFRIGFFFFFGLYCFRYFNILFGHF